MKIRIHKTGYLRGFFSYLETLLATLEASEKDGIPTYVDWTDATNYLNKNDKKNLFDEFFIQPYKIESQMGHEIHEICDWPQIYWGKKNFTADKLTPYRIKWGSNLIKSHIEIRSHINDKVNTFFKTKLSTNTLGIHLRGCDKRNLKTISRNHYISPNLNKYIDTTKGLINKMKFDRLFICSDDEDLINKYIELVKEICEKKQIKIITFNTIRGSKNQCLHLMNDDYQNRIKIAEDALIECLLLSKCKFLIKTGSNFSNFSIYFNPKIQYTDLNERKMDQIRQFLLQPCVIAIYLLEKCKQLLTNN